MDLLELLVVPEALIGVIVGLLAAGVVHWLAPKPEPVFLEALLVALGFVAGLALGLPRAWRGHKRDDN